MVEEPKTAQLSLYVSPRQLHEWEMAAARRGQTVAEFFRQAAIEKLWADNRIAPPIANERLTA